MSTGLLLLPGEHNGSEDSDEDEDRGDLEGQQKIGEEDVADLRDIADCATEIAAKIGRTEGFALR